LRRSSTQVLIIISHLNGTSTPFVLSSGAVHGFTAEYRVVLNYLQHVEITKNKIAQFEVAPIAHLPRMTELSRPVLDACASSVLRTAKVYPGNAVRPQPDWWESLPWVPVNRLTPEQIKEVLQRLAR
jgi:hypothetical protein